MAKKLLLTKKHFKISPVPQDDFPERSRVSHPPSGLFRIANTEREAFDLLLEDLSNHYGFEVKLVPK